MNISDAGLAFLAGWEGLRNQMYDDAGPGKGNATIGVGHLIHYGPIDGDPSEAPYVNGLTDEQCYALLNQDVQRFVSALHQYVTVPLNQNQADALIDFAFNCGIGALAQLAGTVNVGGDVCTELQRYVHDGAGNTLDALVRRREAECVLWNTEEDGVTQAQYDELKAAIGAVLTQTGTLGTKIDQVRLEVLTQGYLAATGRDADLKARIEYEATAGGITLP